MKLHSSSGVRWILSVAALATITACYWYYAKNIARFENSLSNVETCERLAAELDRIRQAPQRARLTTRSADDLGTVVEKSAAEAHLARDRILRIDPQPARRLDKTEYLEQATEIELLAVSLKQVVDLVYNLARSDGELAIGTLRLRMPHETDQNAGQELWLADVILTQRIYAPTTPRRE